ncbi:MAG TPA: IS1595 family transposase [Acetobacteraceae bacterium]|jgi:transposase-like protein|nr:IS1595 family transposase [Acetobacteraceae bacterium]
MTCDLTAPEFTNKEAALAHMEASRWPNGANCPHCGSFNVHKMGGATQAGMFLCNDCRDKFTVRTGTVFERSHIAVHKWLLAMHLMAASKKGISAHQLHRMLGITYKSAWFMAHRIREAMTPRASTPKVGGEGSIVEADDTELTPSRKTKATRTRAENKKFISLIERGGAVRSKMIDAANTREIRTAIAQHVDERSILHTDGAQVYKGLLTVAEHESVNHKVTYVRENNRGKVHTNSAEGYFSLFKRGLFGTYQHISERHMPRYLAEFDFRQNNRVRLGIDDATRAARILKGAEGKRLTYQQPR